MKNEAINEAINTAVNITNYSDDPNIIEMGKHIAETLMNALAEKQSPRSQGCYVAMPKELTAENGAKGLLIGEFHEEREVYNEAFCGCGTCNFCIENPDEPETLLEKVPVSWTTIKEIYAMAVKHLGTQPQAHCANEAPA